MNDDFNRRLAEVHWPDGCSPEEADHFAHNEIFIAAPRHVIWHNLIEAEKWPEWYSNSHDVRVVGSSTGVLEADSVFDWSTFGLALTSRIWEFAPESRIGWFGDTEGLHAYHTWLLLEEENGCRVVMEEVGKGPTAIAMHRDQPDAMHEGHDLWNESLKRLSEGPR